LKNIDGKLPLSAYQSNRQYLVGEKDASAQPAQIKRPSRRMLLDWSRSVMATHNAKVLTKLVRFLKSIGEPTIPQQFKVEDEIHNPATKP
jgi:hypothetical protein